MRIDEIENLDDIVKEKETLSVPIAICLKPTDALRWKKINDRLQKRNKKIKIAAYGRVAILNMMDKIERLLDEQDHVG